jgi:hypothetical protein
MAGKQQLNAIEPDCVEGGLTSPLFDCPHCGEEIQFDLIARVKVINARGFEPDEGSAPRAEKQPEQTPEGQSERAFFAYLESLDGSAVFEAFAQVVGEAMIDKLPRDAKTFFRTWLRTAQPAVLPRFALDSLRDEFPKSAIRYVQALGIGAVTAHGRIVRFLPHRVIAGVRQGAATAALRTGGTPEALETWTRTRFGYVRGHGPLLDSLRSAKSYGDFAK